MCWPAFVRSFFDGICAENGELFQKFDFISSVYKTNIRYNTKKIAADKALVQCTGVHTLPTKAKPASSVKIPSYFSILRI